MGKSPRGGRTGAPWPADFHAAGAALPTDVRHLPAGRGMYRRPGRTAIDGDPPGGAADPKQPLTLRCNVDTVYRYQNPGHAEDTGEGELFNAKRDLDISRSWAWCRAIRGRRSICSSASWPRSRKPAASAATRRPRPTPGAAGAGRQRQLREGPRPGNQRHHPAAQPARKSAVQTEHGCGHLPGPGPPNSTAPPAVHELFPRRPRATRPDRGRQPV